MTAKNVGINKAKLLVVRHKIRCQENVQGCIKYQQNKVQYQNKAGEPHPLKILQGPWQEISIDIIGPLSKLNGKNTIMVIINRFTKMI